MWTRSQIPSITIPLILLQTRYRPTLTACIKKSCNMHSQRTHVAGFILLFLLNLDTKTVISYQNKFLIYKLNNTKFLYNFRRPKVTITVSFTSLSSFITMWRILSDTLHSKSHCMSERWVPSFCLWIIRLSRLIFCLKLAWHILKMMSWR